MAIRIRMYRVGFGDFFLVSFDDRHVVIDCGVFRGTSGTGDLATIDDAIDNLIEETGGKIALIVMTHRHADHIAGFGRNAKKFAKLAVEAVWMPVWESQYDAEATKFQATLTALASDLQDHLDLALAAGGAVDAELYHQIGNATGREGLAAAGDAKAPRGNNAIALDLLKTKLGVTPQYLTAGDRPQLPKSLADLEVGVRVLGPPPIADTDLMQLMDLQKGVGQYLALAAADDAAGSVEPEAKWTPFSAAWRCKPGDLSPRAFVDWMPWRGAELDHGRDDIEIADAARARLEARIEASAPQALALAAAKLDSFLNNQSLVLLFTFGGKSLLFAGDAQGGNWEHWLYETDRADKTLAGPLAKSAHDILASVDVYKVGHHGSTNATPKIVAKELRAGAVALCSTEAGVYGKSTATAVPLADLMDAIASGRTLVRSDAVPVGDHETHGALPKHGDELVPGKLWIDYHL